MKPVSYTVTATLPDEATAREFADWLRGGHIQQVLAGGADEAVVIWSEDPPLRVEARYRFADHATLDRYLRLHAPALRAEGLKRFGPQRGVSLERRVGIIL